MHIKRKTLARVEYIVSKGKSADSFFAELAALFPKGGYISTFRSYIDDRSSEATINIYEKNVLDYYKFFFPGINIIEY